MTILQCKRYIEMNPVRAAVVIAPGDYPWSSYRTHAQGKPSQLVTSHTLYQQLGNTPESRQSVYRILFSEQLPAELIEPISQTTLSGLALGNNRFKDQIQRLTGQSARAGNAERPGKE